MLFRSGSFDLQPCFQKVFTANNSQLEITGSVQLIANFNGRSVPIHALVAKDVRHNLLSLKDCQNLRILQFMTQTCLTTDGQERRLIHDMADYLQQQQPRSAIKSFTDAEQMALDKLLDDYQDVVGDNQMGAFKNATPITLEFKENYKPSRVSRAPKVPIHLRAAVRTELQNLLEAGIIRPIKPGDEIKQTSRCVVVEKPNGTEIGRAHV